MRQESEIWRCNILKCSDIQIQMLQGLYYNKDSLLKVRTHTIIVCYTFQYLVFSRVAFKQKQIYSDPGECHYQPVIRQGSIRMKNVNK